jgi:hypothetical protein
MHFLGKAFIALILSQFGMGVYKRDLGEFGVIGVGEPHLDKHPMTKTFVRNNAHVVKSIIISPVVATLGPLNDHAAAVRPHIIDLKLPDMVGIVSL